MSYHSWIVNEREDGLPLREAIHLRIPAATQGFLWQLIRKKRVLLNGKPVTEDGPARAGAQLALQSSARLEELIHASRLKPAQVLYEGGTCIVLDKPARLATHPAHGHNHDLLSELKAFLKLRHEAFQTSPVHRLDIGTSGPVLFGKGRSSISTLGKMLMADESRKGYLALVTGQPSQNGMLDSAVPAHGKDKASLTRYHCLAASGDHFLLKLELITGRRHQLRKQLADAGWPIVGDHRYRGQPLSGLSRPFLHCFSLSFRRPGDNRAVAICSPLPDDLLAQLTRLGIDPPAFCDAQT